MCPRRGGNNLARMLLRLIWVTDIMTLYLYADKGVGCDCDDGRTAIVLFIVTGGGGE